MTKNNIRWKQRFDHFLNAFKVFDDGISTASQRPLSDLEAKGLSHAFEFTHELPWNVLKDYWDYQGLFHIMGSRDASREAFKIGLATESQVWMDMIKSRNLSSHTYSKTVSNELILDIRNRYHSCFLELKTKIESKYST